MVSISVHVSPSSSSPGSSQDIETQMVDDYEEVVPDSDDERICRPVMLNVKKVISAKPDKVVGESLSRSKDSMLGALGSASKQFQSVYTRRSIKPVRAQPVSDPAIIRCSITDEKNTFGHGSIHTEAYSQKPLGTEDNGSCSLKQVSVETKNNGHLKEFNNEYKDSYKSGKDCTLSGYETEKLNYTESQGLGEPSEADALDFVDRYISCNNFITPEKVALTNVLSREKSTPVSCVKGTQSLAKRAALGTTTGMSGVFEWNDHQIGDKYGGIESEREFMNIFGEGTELRCITKSQSSGKLNVQGYRNLNFQCKEKLQGREVRTGLSSSSLVHNAKDVGEGIQLSEMKFDKEKRDQLCGEPPEQQLQTDSHELDAPDTFDVGFDTQMAAEAMESLCYAPVTNSILDYVHQDAEKKVEQSSEGLAQKCAISTSNHFGLGAAARNLKPTNKPYKKPSSRASKSYCKKAKNKKEMNPELPEAKNVKKVKSLPVNHLDSENPISVKKQLCGSFKLSKASEVNSKQINNYLISPITRRSRRLSTVHQPKETSDMRDVKEVSVLKKRKRTIQHIDSFEVPSCGGTLKKTNSHMSADARNMKVSRQDRKEVNAAQISNLLQPSIWNYPKGKRKQRGPTRNSMKESHICTPSTSFKLGNDNNHTAENKSNSGRNYGSSSFRKPRSSVYTHHAGSSLVKKCENNLLEHKSDERGLADAAPSCSPLTSRIGQDEVKDFKQSEDLVSRTFSSSAVGASHVSNFEILTAENTKASLPTSELDGRPVIQKGSRIPLLKELLSLRISGSVLDCLPKDMRRRREMANVRVMFSNNLDGSVIKQQKKILARLGSSVASCCSDATHFVADRFVRTRNMLEAIALGKPVVTHLWLDSCGQASCYIDEKNYILRDDIKEKEIGFSMHRSLAHAREHPLLKGRRVLTTPKTKPSVELISSLIKAEQGQVAQKSTVKNKLVQDDLLILSCDEDYAQCVPFLEKGVEVYSSELLLNGIIIRKLEFERHRLFVNYPRVHASA